MGGIRGGGKRRGAFRRGPGPACNRCSAITYSEGGAWKEYGVNAAQVFARNSKIARGSTRLWAYARGFLDDALAKGYMLPAPAVPDQAGSESTS